MYASSRDDVESLPFWRLHVALGGRILQEELHVD